jgi:hypothetical protein
MLSDSAVSRRAVAARVDAAIARLVRTRMLYLQCSAQVLETIQVIKRFFSSFNRVEFYKSEAPRSPAFTIADHTRRIDQKPVVGEQLPQAVVRYFWGKISYVQFSHSRILWVVSNKSVLHFESNTLQEPVVA